MRTPIILAYYELEEKNKLKPGITLNINALTEKLGFGNNEENDAFQFCLDNPSIGVYVKAQHNGAKVIEGNDRAPSLSDIQLNIDNGRIFEIYPYAYKGYIRLRNNVANDIFEGKKEIESDPIQQHEGKNGISLQPSLYDYIVGKSFVFEGETKFTWSDLFFMEDEVSLYYKDNIFDWENFYSEKNAEIIENILDKGAISIRQLSAYFFTNTGSMSGSKIFPIKPTASQADVLQLFKEIFNVWKQEDEQWLKNANKEKVYLDKWVTIFPNPEDSNKAITENTPLNSEQALNMLLTKGLLTTELKRLPRFAAQQIGFETNPNYYETHSYEYGKGNNQSLLKIIKSKENYDDQTPRYLSYVKLKEQWRNKAENEIALLCLENKLSAYLPVAEDRVLSFFENQHISICRQKNCGNPFYLKRYKGLEKLVIKDNPHRCDLDNLFSSSSIKIKNDIRNRIDLQSTDFETKFHIKRELKSFGGKNEITKEDLVFLVEEVENIEKGWLFLADETESISRLQILDIYNKYKPETKEALKKFSELESQKNKFSVIAPRKLASDHDGKMDVLSPSRTENEASAKLLLTNSQNNEQPKQLSKIDQ